MLIVCAFAGAARADDLSEVVEFNRDIRPILSDNCFRCHGPSEADREAELRLDVEKNALAARDDGPAIAPGDLKKSLLWRRITSVDADERMPPADSTKKLTDRQIALLGRWIEQGAKWQGHWAFVRPTVPTLPPVKNTAWVRNPIDRFVLARLEQQGLAPAAEADRAALVRRLSFDLTGLPPTLAEVDAFVKDSGADAYEKLVDRLLASEHFGERMTLAWMDAARYGDTSVHHADGPRDMWAWRDWVIRSYNSNLPFDKFTVDQLAGDLIPGATVQQRVASGFNRNHGTTDEGGAIAEEYRVEYVVDRVSTTSTVWMGLTIECAQCHEHKFDPISQKEYYGIYAFFNQSTDGGMQTRNGNAQPTVGVPDLVAAGRVAQRKRQLAELEARLAKHVAGTAAAFEVWQREAAAKAGKTVELPGGALAHWPLDETAGNQVTDAVDAARKGTVKGKALWQAGKIGGAFLLDGGNYLDLGDVADFERTEGFSYGAWIKPDGAGTGAPIARMNDGAAYRGYDLYVQGGRPGVHIIHRWPDNAIKVVAKKQLAANQWHHVFVTYDGSSKAAGVKIYVDGKSEPWDIEQDRLSDTIRAKTPLQVGRRNPGSPYRGTVDDVWVYRRALSATEVAALAGGDPIGPILALAPEKRTPRQTEALRSHYLHNHDEQYRKLDAELARLKAEVAAATKPVTTVMVMQEMPNPRPTYMLHRGHYASPIKNEVIQPATPAFLPPMPKDAPGNRLGLARWLTDPRHPLTARVAVSRHWQMLFGTGLVETAEDFGSQGAWPSHPRLLDWLATDFIEHGWDIKRALKQIVTSATYRQSSKLTAELYRRDPDNRLLARGPRFRLPGEFIRDNALAVSGLLVPKIGGPGVKPYQPPGLWNEVSLSGDVRFVQDHGEKLYRRSMYTYWKRSAPAPALRIFGTPTREKCVLRRQQTNTPLQALVLLNDVQFVEAARMLAQRMMTEGGQTPEGRIRFAYRLATARDPGPQTLEVLLAGYREELAAFQKDESKAKALLAVGEMKRDEKLDAAQHAAWTIVASTILNLDETLTKR